MFSFIDLYLLYGVVYFIRRWYDNMVPSVDEKELDQLMSGDVNAYGDFMQSKKYLMLFMLLEFSWLIIGLKTEYTSFFLTLIVLSILKSIASFKIVKVDLTLANVYTPIHDFIVGVYISLILSYHFQLIDWEFLNYIS